jgi:site-specific recombinase XerD
VALVDAWTDFVLSREAIRCSAATLQFYVHTAGRFVQDLQGSGLSSPQEVSARHVRAYLAQLGSQGKADRTLHAHARAIKTLLRFWHAEGYMPAPVQFAMPRIQEKRLPVLDAAQLRKVLQAGLSQRDLALVMLLADSGLRRAEVCALCWGDIDMSSGLIRVARGKGGKARSAVIGVGVRRALLAYRRTCEETAAETPVFRGQSGKRLSGAGLMLMLRRLSARTGVHVTAHALRRTFAVLSLRGGMDVLHLQALLGHKSQEMVMHYLQLVDDDLLQAHSAHSPIDGLL